MHWQELDTPAVIIDTARVEKNLSRAQRYADANGLPLRPHIKTHKLPLWAHRQQALGAIGITCQKIGEAEVMADGGIDDIFLPYNIIGTGKLDRLLALHGRITLSVTTDNETVLEGYAERFTDAAHPLPVLVECDTGAGRCGVQTPAATVPLALRIAERPGLRFAGLMTYPPRSSTGSVDRWLREAATRLGEAGLPPERISSGGTPDLYRAAEVPLTTEYRPGTYIYSDRMQVAFGHGTLDDCALSVLATVVSLPTADRAILDSGSKALAADTCDAPGYGHVVEYPDAIVTALNEEHGIVDLSACGARPAIGDKVRVVPNHVCVVSNLFDRVNLVENDVVVDSPSVAARGRLS